MLPSGSGSLAEVINTKILTLIPLIPTLIPRIPTPIPCITTLIPPFLSFPLRFPLFPPWFPAFPSSHHPLIPFLDSPFRLLQIA